MLTKKEVYDIFAEALQRRYALDDIAEALEDVAIMDHWDRNKSYGDFIDKEYPRYYKEYEFVRDTLIEDGFLKVMDGYSQEDSDSYLELNTATLSKAMLFHCLFTTVDLGSLE